MFLRVFGVDPLDMTLAPHPRLPVCRATWNNTESVSGDAFIKTLTNSPLPLNGTALVDTKNWINFFGVGATQRVGTLGKIGTYQPALLHIQKKKSLARYPFRDTSQNGAGKAKEWKGARRIC
jgi:hypothetical protein